MEKLDIFKKIPLTWDQYLYSNYPEIPLTWDQYLHNNYLNLVGSVLFAEVPNDLWGENEYRSLRGYTECTQEGKIIYKPGLIDYSSRESFLFEPFAFTQDWTSVKKWSGRKDNSNVVSKSDLKLLDILNIITPLFLFSRNGKIWATEEGIRLNNEYCDEQVFLSEIEICGNLYFNLKKNDLDPYWE